MKRGYSLLSGLFRAGLINLIIGASGSGKTTFVIQVLESLFKGAYFLDTFRPLSPLPKVHYACFDRSAEELDDKRTTLPPSHFTQRTYHTELTNDDIIPKIFADTPEDARILVIDGVGILVEHAISQYHVARFLSKLQRYAQARDLTLILIHHTAKAKNSQGYDDPREKGMGSAAWCQMAACSVVIEKCSPKDVANPYRHVWVLRNDSEQLYLTVRLTSRFELATKEDAASETKPIGREYDSLDLLSFMSHGNFYTPKQLSQATGLSRSQIHRKLQIAVAANQVIRDERGNYCLAPEN